MVQDQLVEYINSQLKTGVSGETIKATLVAAGWQSADVDETLKKVQSPAVATTGAVVTSAPSMTSGASMAAGPKPISTGKVEPQTIRVSDLVSSSSGKAMSMSSTVAKAADTRAEATKKFLTPNTSAGTMGAQTTGVHPSSRGSIITEVFLGLLMVIFGVVAVYLFFTNRGLAGQVASLTAQSGGITGQVAALQNQLNASTTALAAEVASTTAANQELALDLSFYAAPLGTTATSTSTAMLSGTVSVGSTKSYVITTADGAKVLVANSKDPKVMAAMQPLVGTTTVQFGGTYTPGVDSITLTAINGASLVTPPPVPAAATASSTATSTGATASTTPATSTSSSTGQ